MMKKIIVLLIFCMLTVSAFAASQYITFDQLYQNKFSIYNVKIITAQNITNVTKINSTTIYENNSRVCSMLNGMCAAYNDTSYIDGFSNSTIVRIGSANKTTLYCGNITGASYDVCSGDGGSGSGDNNYTTSIMFINGSTKTLHLLRNGMINLTASFSDQFNSTQEIFTVANNGTFAKPATCGSGYAVQNTTATGVHCVPLSGVSASGDNNYTTSIMFINGSSTKTLHLLRNGMINLTASFSDTFNTSAEIQAAANLSGMLKDWSSSGTSDGNNYTTSIMFINGSSTKTLHLLRNGMINLTASFSDLFNSTQEIFTVANNGTFAKPGTCAAGEAVQNTTATGVQCVSLSGAPAGDSYWSLADGYLSPANVSHYLSFLDDIQMSFGTGKDIYISFNTTDLVITKAVGSPRVVFKTDIQADNATAVSRMTSPIYAFPGSTARLSSNTGSGYAGISQNSGTVALDTGSSGVYIQAGTSTTGLIIGQSSQIGIGNYPILANDVTTVRTTSTPRNGGLQTQDASGNNTNGGNFTIRGGQATGDAKSGNFKFDGSVPYTNKSGTWNSTRQTNVTWVEMEGDTGRTNFYGVGNNTIRLPNLTKIDGVTGCSAGDAIKWGTGGVIYCG